MADRFFVEVPPPVRGEFILSGPDAHHLTTVRRFSPGDRVTLFCGDGNEYAAEVVAVGKKAVTLNIVDVQSIDREPAFPIVVASALPKGDRADYLLEKLVEVGATRFVPLVTVRSVVIPKEGKTEKFERAVIEASKQCGRNRLMRVDVPQPAAIFWLRNDLPPNKFLLHTSEAEVQKPAALPGGVVFAVGPEGGFAPEEVETALQAGWQILRLGPRVLRVETAAVVVAAWAAGQ